MRPNHALQLTVTGEHRTPAPAAERDRLGLIDAPAFLTGVGRTYTRRHELIVATVTFRLPKRWSVAQAAEVFRSTAPKYLGKPGLVRKHYFVSEGGDRAGGIYFWESKAAAEACYTQDWKGMVTQKYGAEPDIQYAEVPVSVDNVTHAIETG